MPQMSPMWWLTLMIIMNLSMMIFNSILYFSKMQKMNFVLKKKNYMNWKW